MKNNHASSLASLYSNQPIIELHLKDLTHLHEQIIKHWPGFISRALEGWKSNGFLESHVPISVTSRFGHDQIICGPDLADVKP